MTKLLCGAARLAAHICHSRIAFPVASVCALLLAVGSVLVGADPSTADHGGGSAEVAPGPEAFATPEIERGQEEGRESAERRRQQRNTPEARQRRRESRSAYRGRSRDEALALAREKHRGVLVARPWQPLRLENGQEVKSYRGDYSALVSVGGGQELLAESTLPLRALDESGDLAPVDLDLEDRGLNLVPSNPLIDIRVSKNPTIGVSFERAGFRFGLAGAALTGPPILTDGKAFWDNVATDMDLLVRPVPLGVETFFLLRSAESPESATLTFELPPGSSLREAVGQNRAVDIVRGAAVVGRVEAPTAYDAEGEAVSVSYEVRGPQLVVQFPHRAGDYAYPLMVDPIVGDTVKENFNLDGNGKREYPNDPFSGWAFFENAPAGFFPHYVSTDNANRGLVVYAWQGGDYRDGYYGEWYWQAPRQSYIERADFGYVDHTAPWGTCLLEGIYSPSRGNWDYGRWSEANGTSGSSPTLTSPEACSAQNANYKAHCVGTSCIPHNPPSDPRGTPGNLMAVGLYKNGNHILGSWPTVRMEGATMWLFDNDVPNMGAPSHSNLPSGWTKSATITTSLTATEPDPGLGVKYFNLYRGENLETFIDQRQHPCTGDRHYPCPVSWSIPDTSTENAYRRPEKNVAFSYSTDSMPEGVNTMKAVAYDALGKCRMPSDSGSQCRASATAQWTVKVDRSAPSVQLSGRLKDLENKGLYDDAYSLGVDASDPHSGIKSVEMLVDDRRLRTEHYVEESCSTAGCPNSRTYSFVFNPDDVPDGERTIKLIVKDELETATEVTWKVVVDRRGDIYRAQKYAVFGPGERVSLDGQWARINTHDARSEDEGWITTRTTVNDNGEVYDEVRSRSSLSEPGDADQEEAYTVTKGRGADDPNLPIVADMLAPARELAGQTPTRTGALSDVLEPWQTPPPAYGETYALYEVDGEHESEDGQSRPAVERIWIDERTKMPIRFVVVSSTGEELSPPVHFSYDLARLETSEVAADFFRIGAPPQKGMERETTFSSSQESVGPVMDEETNRSFRGYYLGPNVTLNAGSLGFTESDVIRTRISASAGTPPPSEPDLIAGDEPSAGADKPSTLVDAYYTMSNGLDLPYDPLWVTSMARTSSEAAAWRAEYVDQANAVQGDPADPEFLQSGVVASVIGLSPTVAYVLSLSGDRTSVLIEIGDSTVIIEGRLTKDEVPTLISKLEVLP